MADPRTCRGCGQEMRGDASREHILPRWLHPHIELEGVSLQHRSVNEEESRLLRSHDLENFVFKSICSRCNNGWMAKLEDDVKLALLPLIKGQRSAASLDKNEATVIARWAFKTAFMILPGQKTIPIPWHQFKTWAKAGAGAPDPAVIFALSDLQSRRGFGYVTESDDLADSVVHPVNVRVAICLGSLLLVVLLPMDKLGRTPGRGHELYRLLWPLDIEPVGVQLNVDPYSPRPYGELIKYLSGFAHAGVRRGKDHEASKV
jgi:hypothetical protein